MKWPASLRWIPWFLYQIKEVSDATAALGGTTPENASPAQLRKAKRLGISDERLAEVWSLSGNQGIEQVRNLRRHHGLRPVYKLVDTCAAEFESYTPYLYSCYDEEDEAPPTVEAQGHHPRQRTQSHRAGH